MLNINYTKTNTFKNIIYNYKSNYFNWNNNVNNNNFIFVRNRNYSTLNFNSDINDKDLDLNYLASEDLKENSKIKEHAIKDFKSVLIRVE